MMDGATFDELHALLDWQVELGADEAIQDHPVNRYELEPRVAAPVAAKTAAEPPPKPPAVDPALEAQGAAERAGDLAALEAALRAFPHSDLTRGASTVFAQGAPEARVMVIGEAPDRDEDRSGHPFAGAPGRLFDAMFAAIGLSREAAAPDAALYLSAAFPWRPPGDLSPDPAQIALIRPFVERHIALAQPDVLVLMGGLPCEVLLGKGGILRLRGKWTEVLGRPALPMLHPRWLLERPEAKRDAWSDLLGLKARLKT